MAFAFVQSASAQDDTSDASSAVALTGVTAGHLIVLWVKWEGIGDATVTVSDATSSLTVRPTNPHSNNDLNGTFAYLLAANSGDRTYTVTWTGGTGGPNRPFKWLHVRQFSYTGTASFEDDDVTAEDNGAGNDPLSGAIDVSGTDAVVVGGVGVYDSATNGTPIVGGSAATGEIGSGSSAYSFYRILTAPMAAGTASCTMTDADPWVCSAIAFQAAAAGAAAGPLVPRRMVTRARRRDTKRRAS